MRQDSIFYDNLNKYIEFTNRYNRKPEYKSKNNDEVKLANWASNTRYQYKLGKLSQERVDAIKKYCPNILSVDRIRRTNAEVAAEKERIALQKKEKEYNSRENVIKRNLKELDINNLDDLYYIWEEYNVLGKNTEYEDKVQNIVNILDWSKKDFKTIRSLESKRNKLDKDLKNAILNKFYTKYNKEDIRLMLALFGTDFVIDISENISLDYIYKCYKLSESILYSKLSQREVNVLNCRFKKIMTLVETSKVLEVNIESVRHRELKALRKLRRYLYNFISEYAYNTLLNIIKIENIEINNDILELLAKSASLQYNVNVSTEEIRGLYTIDKKLNFRVILVLRECDNKDVKDAYNQIFISNNNNEKALKIITKYLDLKEKKLKEMENIDIDELRLSVRAYNALRRRRLNTVKEICEYIDKNNGLSSIRNLGTRSIEEVYSKIYEHMDYYLGKKRAKELIEKELGEKEL